MFCFVWFYIFTIRCRPAKTQVSQEIPDKTYRRQRNKKQSSMLSVCRGSMNTCSKFQGLSPKIIFGIGCWINGAACTRYPLLLRVCLRRAYTLFRLNHHHASHVCTLLISAPVTLPSTGNICEHLYKVGDAEGDQYLTDRVPVPPFEHHQCYCFTTECAPCVKTPANYSEHSNFSP